MAEQRYPCAICRGGILGQLEFGSPYVGPTLCMYIHFKQNLNVRESFYIAVVQNGGSLTLQAGPKLKWKFVAVVHDRGILLFKQGLKIWGRW